MIQPFRRTTQLLAPASHTFQGDKFNIYPAHPIGPRRIDLGFSDLAHRLAVNQRIIIDGAVGVMWEDFRARLTETLKGIGVVADWIDVKQALLPEDEIDRLIEPYFGGSDPIFGMRNTRPLRDFFVPVKLRELEQQVAARSRTIVYGTGAALVSTRGFVVYVDVPKNEIQFRSRAGSITNLGARVAGDPKLMYKRFYFVDWPPVRTHQAELLPRIDLIVDGQRPDEPTLMSGQNLRAGLSKVAHSWFRVRPWFEPGPWGGNG